MPKYFLLDYLAEDDESAQVEVTEQVYLMFLREWNRDPDAEATPFIGDYVGGDID